MAFVTFLLADSQIYPSSNHCKQEKAKERGRHCYGFLQMRRQRNFVGHLEKAVKELFESLAITDSHK